MRPFVRRGRPGACALGLALALGAWMDLSAEPPAPDLKLVDPVTGKSTPLPTDAALVHLAFFATWCPDCVNELETLSDYEDRWTDKGYRLVLVAVASRQTAERLASFASTRRPPGLLLFDADGSVERAYGVGRVPTHVLIDRSGAEVGRATDAGAVGPLIDRGLGKRTDPRP